MILTSSRSACAMTMPARRGHNMPMSSPHSKTPSRLTISFSTTTTWIDVKVTKQTKQWNIHIQNRSKIETTISNKSNNVLTVRMWKLHKKIVDCLTHFHLHSVLKGGKIFLLLRTILHNSSTTTDFYHVYFFRVFLAWSTWFCSFCSWSRIVHKYFASNEYFYFLT